ncbi:hypothetical protein O6H91_18G036100 [Diphasiastrum complanatum]|uniref:Uncharacterized protein n=1 Tax=Diphasiastrum complanatum TaxID=34168 RepID=A0ACC2AZY0_DIPCM|nr:hypothetical protein O6H91_18G036100 [Diphasiastrum complanatum]
MHRKMASKLHRLNSLSRSVLFLIALLLACSSMVCAARQLKSASSTAHPLYFKDPANLQGQGPDECGFEESSDCSPPMENFFGASKRLVPGGPNPLHNR